MRMSFIRILLVHLIPLSLYAAVSNYARNCQEKIGVPVPDVDCKNPGGSLVDVGQSAQGKCQFPSHGLSGCNPGTRFIKYTDTFRRRDSDKDETVTTMIMCRKTNADIERKNGATDDIYSDIGVIQYNETKHATCWFSSTESGQRPTVQKEGNRMSYPSPSTEAVPGFWENPNRRLNGRPAPKTQPESRCIECHVSGVWLRSPFAMRVSEQQGKGFQRTGRIGPYQPGNGNNIPNNHERIAKRGLTCSVGKGEWNTGDGNMSPRQVRINSAKYDEKFPLTQAQNGESSGYCTSCHYLGVGGGGRRVNQFCNYFLPEFRTGQTQDRLRTGLHFWMPPEVSKETTPQQYQTQYGRALAAAEWCCKNIGDPDFRDICLNNRFTSVNEQEGPVLRDLATRGPCALCPDCVANGGEQPPLRRSH